MLKLCSLGFSKGNFPLRFPRKSPRPPCFGWPLAALTHSGICVQVSVAHLTQRVKYASLFVANLLKVSLQSPYLKSLSTSRKPMKVYLYRASLASLSTCGKALRVYVRHLPLRPLEMSKVSYLLNGFAISLLALYPLPLQKNAHLKSEVGGGGLLRAYNGWLRTLRYRYTKRKCHGAIFDAKLHTLHCTPKDTIKNNRTPHGVLPGACS